MSQAQKATAPVEKSFSQMSGEEQVQFLTGVMALPHLPILASALETAGKVKGGTVSESVKWAETFIDEKYRPDFDKIAAIYRASLSPAPAVYFDTNQNTYGVRIGELFAKALGFSKWYTASTKANLKDAKSHLVKGLK